MMVTMMNNRSRYFWFGLTFIAMLVLYYPVLQKLLIDWGQNDDYSHGYFIPFISLYMVYSIRDSLKEKTITPSLTGLVILCLGLFVLVVGKIGSEFFLQRTSLLIVISGLICYMLGREFFFALIIPVAYLFFMIPLPVIIWNKIAFPLQLFGSFLTEHVVRMIGIPIFREGNVLHLAQTTLEVVGACSGLRSLMTMFAMAGALVWFSGLSKSKKIILFFSAAPVAIFANIVRLTVTAILASFYGSKVAHGFLHDFSGIVTFLIGLVLLLTVNTSLGKTGSEKQQ